MRETVADIHELGEYLRVEEIARRFGVPVDDVLAACSVLGFDATDATSLIEIHEFILALKSAPARQPVAPRPSRPRWFDASVAASVAALLVAAAAMFLVSRDDTSPTERRAATSAAAYRAELKKTYNASVAGAPQPTDYEALAQKWRLLTPPAGLQAEHDKLIAEAEKVADLASASTTDCSAVPSCASEQLSESLQTTSAANELKDHLDKVETPRLR